MLAMINIMYVINSAILVSAQIDCGLMYANIECRHLLQVLLLQLWRK